VITVCKSQLLRASWTESEIIGRLDTPENNNKSTL
jgi:hypothetical protein